MGEFSRRDFIKTACISVGALAASSSGVYAIKPLYKSKSFDT